MLRLANTYTSAPNASAKVAASPEAVRLSFGLARAAAPLGLVARSTNASPLVNSFGTPNHTRAVAYAREEEVSAEKALGEIKERAGLTWAQVATIFRVSSRTIHNWMAGEGMADRHRHTLSDALDTVRSLAGERSYRIRNALLGDAAPSRMLQKTGRTDGPLLESDNTPPRHRPALVKNTLKILE